MFYKKYLIFKFDSDSFFQPTAHVMINTQEVKKEKNVFKWGRIKKKNRQENHTHMKYTHTHEHPQKQTNKKPQQIISTEAFHYTTLLSLWENSFSTSSNMNTAKHQTSHIM